jgi:(p)ppGpp synthase/HD superfamily hydrolase
MQLSPLFSEALALASQLHATQFRKGSNIPYVSHLLAVTAIVLEFGGNETQAIAAVLHDAVEDQGGPPTLALIRQQFGDQVAAIVAALSDTDQDPKPPWRERKSEHLEQLRQAPTAAYLVLAADKLHNVRTSLRDYRQIGPALWQRFGGGRDGMLWYYHEMQSLLAPHLPSELNLELAETLAALQLQIQQRESSEYIDEIHPC